MREFYCICSFEVITMISEIEKSKKKNENRVSEFKRHVLILIQSRIKLTFNLCDMTRVFLGTGQRQLMKSEARGEEARGKDVRGKGVGILGFISRFLAKNLSVRLVLRLNVSGGQKNFTVEYDLHANVGRSGLMWQRRNVLPLLSTTREKCSKCVQIRRILQGRWP